MASRRMFSKDVVCSDRFLDMPASAQALYFQYGLEADDDGFVSAPKKILRLTNASDDDLKILVAKGFLIPFDSGVVVIRDWKINNYLRRDRYTPTRFKEEFEQLDTIDDRYQLHVLAVGIPDDNHVVDMRDTQVRLGKDSIGKGSINNNVGRKMSHFTPPTVEEVQEYCFERGNAVDAQSFVDFYTSKGCGYDKICTFASVPARKTDYQAYLRKALKILNDMLLLKNMPADFPAEKI